MRDSFHRVFVHDLTDTHPDDYFGTTDIVLNLDISPRAEAELLFKKFADRYERRKPLHPSNQKRSAAGAGFSKAKA